MNSKKTKLFRWLAGGVVVLGALLITFSQVKKVSPLSWGWFGPVNAASDVAIHGFDPVELHEGRATQGNTQFTAEHSGVSWHFASEKNMRAFEAEPQRWLPENGGFCSFAVSRGFTADSNPEVFTVRDGKLFLFDSEGVKRDWLAEVGEGVVQRTAANWAKH